jgi:DNA recombination protein RmuC
MEQTMNEPLLWLILFGTALTAVLAIVLLVRGAGKEVRDELRAGREEARHAAKELREEVSAGLKSASDTISTTLDSMGKVQRTQLDGMTSRLKELTDSNQRALDGIRTTLDSQVKELRESNEKKLDEMRKEVSEGLKSTNDTLSKALENMSRVQQTQLEETTKQLREVKESNQSALDRIRDTFDSRFRELQESNEKKLDEMRKTVDEKLQETLEKRLGEAFKQVSDRLEDVHKGLGEMKNLATGVGDLKRVLTNVKVRGTWGEVQLGAILEQILTPDQYEKNVRVNTDSAERVEYAVRLPGPKDDPMACVWLPIDSKFPQEDYLRLQEASKGADVDAVHAAEDDLARTVRAAAKDIHGKYVNPPSTTDFAIMFLATEGLYAEVLRQPGFVEELQHRYRVVLAGPTTLAAILSSLRMGFQTLAIEQRAAEVWKILGAVKTEFGKFAGVLNKVKRQLDAASNTIEETGKRSRAMERRLRSVEQLPEAEASKMLALPTAADDAEPEDAEVEDEATEGEQE